MSRSTPESGVQEQDRRLISRANSTKYKSRVSQYDHFLFSSKERRHVVGIFAFFYIRIMHLRGTRCFLWMSCNVGSEDADHQRVLKECLKSLAAQTRQPDVVHIYSTGTCDPRFLFETIGAPPAWKLTHREEPASTSIDNLRRVLEMYRDQEDHTVVFFAEEEDMYHPHRIAKQLPLFTDDEIMWCSCAHARPHGLDGVDITFDEWLSSGGYNHENAFMLGAHACRLGILKRLLPIAKGDDMDLIKAFTEKHRWHGIKDMRALYFFRLTLTCQVCTIVHECWSCAIKRKKWGLYEAAATLKQENEMIACV